MRTVTEYFKILKFQFDVGLPLNETDMPNVFLSLLTGSYALNEETSDVIIQFKCVANDEHFVLLCC